MMLEQGLVDKWMNELIANSSNCNTLKQVVSSYGKPVVRLSFKEIGFFFLIITCGSVLSVVVLIAEISNFDRYRHVGVPSEVSSLVTI